MHGGDNPLHPSPPPSNGSKLLLRLVQNRHQNYQQSPPQQPPQEPQYNLPDPAIAAVGPTVPNPFQQQGYFGNFASSPSNSIQTPSFFSAPHKHFDHIRRQQQEQSTANAIQYGPIEVRSNMNNNHNNSNRINGFDPNSRLDPNPNWGNGSPDRRRPGPPPGFLNKFGNQRRDLEGFNSATTTQYGPTEAGFSRNPGNQRRDLEGFSNVASQYGPTELGFSRNLSNQRRDLEGFNNVATQYGPNEVGLLGNLRRDLEGFNNAKSQYGPSEAGFSGNLRRDLEGFNNASTQYGSIEAGILGNLRRDIEVMKNAAAKSAMTTQYGPTELGFSSNYGNQRRDLEGFNGPIEAGFSGNQRRDFEGLNNAATKTSQYGPTKVGFLNNGGFELNSVRSHEKERRFSSRDKNGDSSSNVDGGVGLCGQIDHPGLPSGSSLHSVPASNLDDNEIGLDDEIDDLSEQLVGSVLGEDQSDEKNVAGGKKKFHRDKDFRSDARGKWILSQRMRNSRSLIECRRDIDRLDSQFLAIYESLMPVEEEIAKQKQLLTLLEQLVCKEWPNAKLYLYGSCANSFGFPNSDIDVCLAIDDQDINKSEMLLKLADILQSGNFQDVQALTRARVPIVKLMDPVTGISCDICINNVLAVVNTKLLRDYAEIDVRLRQLAYLVKHWAKSRGVNETYHGTLSSYAYVLMCIHFLQLRNPPILPCLQNMRSTYAVTVEDIECSFFDQVEKLRDYGARNKENISRLLWGFFSYWAYCHDYANKVISVRSGCILSKQEKDWTRRIGNDRHLICIEDPFETSHDLGRVVDKHSIRVLREEFERAAEIMQYDPNPCVALFEPYTPR